MASGGLDVVSEALCGLSAGTVITHTDGEAVARLDGAATYEWTWNVGLATPGITVIVCYTAPGNGPGIFEWPAFYELEVDGVRLVDWVALIAGEPLNDVHCTDCEPG